MSFLGEGGQHQKACFRLAGSRHALPVPCPCDTLPLSFGPDSRTLAGFIVTDWATSSLIGKALGCDAFIDFLYIGLRGSFVNGTRHYLVVAVHNRRLHHPFDRIGGDITTMIYLLCDWLLQRGKRPAI